MSPKFNHGINNDMVAIPEESEMNLLSIPADECAAQLTAMDAVSVMLFCGSHLKLCIFILLRGKLQLTACLLDEFLNKLFMKRIQLQKSNPLSRFKCAKTSKGVKWCLAD